VNLAPVLPLDGGHVMEQALRIRNTPKALKISMVVGGALALAAALTSAATSSCAPITTAP